MGLLVGRVADGPGGLRVNLLSLLGPGGDTGWMADAACGDGPQSVFFIEGKGHGSRPYHAARAICAECPVRQRCLDYAMAVEGDASGHDRFGVWGGLSPAERAELAGRRPRLCAICEREFTPAVRSGRVPKCCSKVCLRVHRARRDRERDGTTSGEGAHGSYGKYQAGCRCASCKRHAALRRAAQRHGTTAAFEAVSA